LVNPKQTKVFGKKSSLRETGRVFPIKYTILSFGKCHITKFQVSKGVVPKMLFFLFPNGIAGQWWVNDNEKDFPKLF